jgi:hypothetical protein
LTISVEASTGHPLHIRGCALPAAGSLVGRARVYHATGYFVNLDDIYLNIDEYYWFLRPGYNDGPIRIDWIGSQAIAA